MLDNQSISIELPYLNNPILAPMRERRITSGEQLIAENIIAFTFRPTVDACLQLWFGKSHDTDADIWQRFEGDVDRASRGELDHWATADDNPRMFLALIILLDQFRRNMYREKADMYAADRRCLDLTKSAFQRGLIDKLSLVERVFPCLVLTHSETAEDQYLCLTEWAKVEAQLSPTDPLRVFREVFQRHVSVVEKYGRFPHRNKLLGRASTSKEIEFLSDADFRFDLPLVKTEDGSFSFQGELIGHEVNSANGLRTDLVFEGFDAALTRVENDIRLKGYSNVENIVLRKFIVERNMPTIGGAKYREIKTRIDKSNQALEKLWPRIAWQESFVCSDRTYCVYLADCEQTLHDHALLADMPIEAVNEVKSIVDPRDFHRDIAHL